MSQTLPRLGTPAPSPGSEGLRPASVLLAYHGGDNARRPHSAGLPPDSGDGPAPEPAPAPPDFSAQPALESPGTTTHSPPRRGTALQAPCHGGVLAPTALSGW